ncbi:MAG: tetraacyldisaccharide 4'-kinase [Candidatus Neomarinimicrobiota bacterium]
MLARLRPLLWPVAMFYRALSWWRNFFYNIGFFISRRVSVPVVSIGNVTVGGTGKTPATVFTAEHLLNLGFKVGILSRGYGRRMSGTVVVSDGQGVLCSAEEAGDEPYLMATRLPQVPVVVDEDRYRGAKSMIDRFHPDILVLDDAFQHRGLARDCDIVLLDASAPLAEYRIFPRGELREPLTALRRADLVVWTRSNLGAPAAAIKERVAALGVPQVTSDMPVSAKLIDVATGTAVPPEQLQGEPVLAFCGIVRPANFYGALMELGLEPETVRYYPDHYSYSAEDLRYLSELTEGNRLVMLTTEKDAVKLEQGFVEDHRVYAVRIEFRLGGPELETFGAVLAQRLPLPRATPAAGEA